MLDSALVAHLSALVRQFPPRAVSAQHVATLANAWAKAEVKDEALWHHFSAAIRSTDRDELDLQVPLHRSLQRVAAVFADKAQPTPPLSDSSLPRISGRHARRLVRQIPSRPRAPFSSSRPPALPSALLAPAIPPRSCHPRKRSPGANCTEAVGSRG